MVAIFKMENGPKFTGLIAENEEKAWEYLDKTYGEEIYGVWYGVNRRAFEIREAKMITDFSKKM